MKLVSPLPTTKSNFGIAINASQVVLAVKNPPANEGDIRDVGSNLGLGRSLEEGMATHSSMLAWRIPWSEEPDRLVLGVAKSQT